MLERMSICFICTAILGTIVHWRLFDGVAVAMLLSIPFISGSKSLLKAVWKNGKIINSLFVMWLFVVFIGDFLADTPLEVFNFRWIVGAYIIYLHARTIHVSEDSQLSWVSIVLSVGVAAATLYSYKVSHLLPSYENRFQGFYSNPNVYGMTLSLAFAFLFSWVLTAVYFKKTISYFDLFALLILGITIYLTYSRSSWGGIIVAATTGGFILRKNRKIILGYIGLTLAFLTLYLSNFLHLKDRLLYTVNSSGAAASSVRIEIWKANFAMFLDHPIFGVGYWHNTQLLEKYASGKLFYDDVHAHAHDQYLQVLSGTGAVGFIIYVGVLTVIAVHLYRQFKFSKDIVVKRFALCALLTFTSYLITSLTDSPLDARETRDLLMILLAGALGVIHSRAIEAPKTQSTT